MSTRKIKDAVDLTTNEKIYFRGHAKATYLSDGRNVEEALGEIPSGESSVFEAVYEETTYEEIVEQFNQGKICYLNRGSVQYTLTFITNNAVYFGAAYDDYHYYAICSKTQRTDLSHNIKDLDNGNIELYVKGTTREVATPQYVENAIQQSGGGGGMTTPSGYPMHYLYVTAGAEYNDTGADIERTGMYGDTIVWKNEYWWLNELGDITNDQMRAIFVYWQKILQSNCYHGAKLRTNLPFQTSDTSTSSDTRDLETSFAHGGLFEVFDWRVTAPLYAPNKVWNNNFIYCYYLKKILGEISATNVTEIGNSTFSCSALEEIRIKGLKVKVFFSSCAKLSYASINYLISNSAATKAITLTLHATALANAEAAYLSDTTQDHTTYPTLSDWALSKNIQIATA